ncbi:MAG: glutamine synthetase type III, partial [Chitinophagales bacterium]|nr:glutamine synthetase type III [Chitinophagales bacterium]
INRAVDHNQLLMDLIDKVAANHHLKVLLHEKPYAGINGSGKHNNWSLVSNTGKNLLSPGSTPKTNLQFLTFFINTIKAVQDNADLLRASIASAGNAHRLGANEAPPAIMSIFIGSQLTSVLEEIEKKVTTKGSMSPELKTELKLNIGKIPELLKDNTDRNRTSPFAFTGNKFEFRAVGSSTNSSSPMIVLNTIVAHQLKIFKTEVDALINKKVKKDVAILRVLRKYIVESKDILFEGNGYGEEWKAIAKKRNLSNITSTPIALDAYLSKQSVEVFTKNEVFTELEINARHSILLEEFTKKIQIESRVAGDLAINHIIPTAITYQTKLVQNINGLQNLKLGQEYYKIQLAIVKEISDHIAEIKVLVDKMTDARRKANKIESPRECAISYHDKVVPYLQNIRRHVDKLEIIVDDEIWPLPKYREMITLK